MSLWRSVALIGLLVGLQVLAAAGAARAQTAPPPATTPPTPSPTPAPPPPAAVPGAPAAAPGPAAPGTSSISPLSPTLAPEPAPAPPVTLEQRAPYTHQPPPPRPFYKRTWFWVGLAVIVATVNVVLIVEGGDLEPPSTTYGNMHAF